MEKTYSKGQKAILWTVFAIFSIYAFTLIFPFVWMLINSFKTNQEFFTNIWSLPKNIGFKNYVSAFNYVKKTKYGSFNLASMFFVSVFLTVVGTIINTLLSAMTAYVVAKYDFFGKKAIYNIAIFSMIIPIVGTLPSQIRLMNFLKINDSIIGILILYSNPLGLSFLILYGYFKNVSPTYQEAAFIDGAGHFQVFLKIMLPMARPTLIALAIINGIGIWNDYLTPAIFLKSIPTLAVGIDDLSVLMRGQAAYAEMFATMIISIIPILIIFVIFRKTIMENTIAGGLKG